MKLGHRPALDGIRGIAIGIVLVSHLGDIHSDNGQVGVGLFFVLSGFLITTLLLEEREGTGTIGVRAFYARRARRLLPALGFLLTLLLAYGASTGDLRLQSLRVLIAATYSANWIETFTRVDLSWLKHTWSLAVEEQFYLVWPVALIFASRWGRKGTVALILGGITLSALGRAQLIPASPGWFGTDTRALDLLLGAGASVLWRSGLRVRPSITYGVTALVLAAPVMLLALPLAAVEPLAAVAGAVAVVGAASSDPRLLSLAPVRRLGVISYGVYLWHFPILYRMAFPQALWEQVLLVAMLLVVAELSYRLLEQPILNWRRRPQLQPAFAAA